MSDEELIAMAVKAFETYAIGLTNKETDRLIALARIGAAVKPLIAANQEEGRLKSQVNAWMDEQAKQLHLATNSQAPMWAEYANAAEKRNEELVKFYALSSLPKVDAP